MKAHSISPGNTPGERKVTYSVYTIGYEKRSPEELIRIIRDLEIVTVIDVRISAKSRKKGFDQNSLKNALASVNVRYIHMPELGVPKEKRDYLLQARGSEEFLETYLEILGENSAKIGDILRIIQKEKALLLCYERKYSDCHRSALSDLIVRTFPGLVSVSHIS